MIIEVTEEGYRQQLAAGISKDEMLSVGYTKGDAAVLVKSIRISARIPSK